MRKLIFSYFLVFIFNTNMANAMPVIDMTNFAQNLITAISTAADYAKRVTDWRKQVEEYKKMTDEYLSLGDMLDDINKLSKAADDIYKTRENITSFNEEVLKDPKAFLEKEYKDFTDKYQIYDKCKDYTGEMLNACIRSKINYAFGNKQEIDYSMTLKLLREQLAQLFKDLNNAQTQKDRETSLLAIEATRAKIEMAKEQKELDDLHYRNEERIVAEQKKEMMRQSLASRYSVSKSYDNIMSN